MEDLTLDGTLAWLEMIVKEQKPLSKIAWLDAAAKLNILVSDLDDEISSLKFHLDRKESKRKRITETIRIAKKRAELFETAP